MNLIKLYFKVLKVTLQELSIWNNCGCLESEIGDNTLQLKCVQRQPKSVSLYHAAFSFSEVLGNQHLFIISVFLEHCL